MNSRPPRAHRVAALYLAGPDNIDTRRADLERLAKAKGWPRTELYHDTDGYKPELRRLQAGVMAGAVPAVIVGDIVELGRSVIEVIETLSWLDERGVFLYAITPTIDNRMMAGRGALNLAVHLAEFHSGIRRERLDAGKPGRSGGARKRPPAK